MGQNLPNWRLISWAAKGRLFRFERQKVKSMRITAEPVARLIDELNKLPTIGPKTASRLAFYILRGSKDDASALAQAILDVKEKIIYCSECYNLTENDPCVVCSSKDRDPNQICVVEEPLDVAGRINSFR